MADKSNPYATRFRQDVADKIEAYREQKEEETGAKPGKSQAIHDLAVIGIESEVGEGTPRERELRRDIQELQDKVDRLENEHEDEVHRLEQEKADLLSYTVVGGGAVVGVFMLMSAVTLESYITSPVFDPLGRLGIVVALLATIAFLFIPVLNRLGVREKVLGIWAIVLYLVNSYSFSKSL